MEEGPSWVLPSKQDPRLQDGPLHLPSAWTLLARMPEACFVDSEAVSAIHHWIGGGHFMSLSVWQRSDCLS